MTIDYYKRRKKIAKVDRKGNVIGEIEKWEAHEKGILHRGFSIALIYKNQYVLQYRRHPAFDALLDLSTSSHQIFINAVLESAEEASLKALKREWDITGKDIVGKPKNLGSVYYKAKDPKSVYVEHEICDILKVKIRKIPTPNSDFAYGFSLASKKDLKRPEIYRDLSPWTKKAIEKNLI